MMKENERCVNVNPLLTTLKKIKAEDHLECVNGI